MLAAVHLRRTKPEAQITLIDASGTPGTGAAYGTTDPTHLLNVPAQRMSAWPDDPDHFSRWLDERAVTTFEGFAPRLAYGRYLREQLAAADVRIEAAEVVGLVPGEPTQVKLNDGRTLSADVVVLASGRPDGGMPDSLERAFAPVLAADTDGRVVVDPWAPGALTALGARRPANVLVIGFGTHGRRRGSPSHRARSHGHAAVAQRRTPPPIPLRRCTRRRTSPGCTRYRDITGAIAQRARCRSDTRPRSRVGLAASDRRDTATHSAPVAIAGLGGSTPIPARGLAPVGDPAPPHAADNCRRD